MIEPELYQRPLQLNATLHDFTMMVLLAPSTTALA